VHAEDRRTILGFARRRPTCAVGGGGQTAAPLAASWIPGMTWPRSPLRCSRRRRRRARRPGGHRKRRVCRPTTARPLRRTSTYGTRHYPYHRRRAARAAARGPRAAGRRRTWRLHLGCDRPAAGGAVARIRRHLRHLGGRDERGGDGGRLRREWARGCARRARGLLAPRRARCHLQPLPAHAARHGARPLVPRQLAGLRDAGPAGPRLLTLRARTLGAQPAGGRAGRERGFRPPGPCPDQAVHHRHQCAHRPRPRLPQRRHHAAGAAGLRLPADAVPGRGDRWRGLLGRWLLGQPHHHAAGARVPLPGHNHRAHQPGGAPGHAAQRAPDPESAERGLLQPTPCC
jgi:hypothetical protein